MINLINAYFVFRLGILSDDGAAKVFDESADGYVRSELTGAIFLQKAKNARRVYAKVRFFLFTWLYCSSLASI